MAYCPASDVVELIIILRPVLGVLRGGNFFGGGSLQTFRLHCI
jgi:hypothetical protein